MDGVGISIIERPRPLPGHDTPNPTEHPYTLKCEEPLNDVKSEFVQQLFVCLSHFSQQAAEFTFERINLDVVKLEIFVDCVEVVRGFRTPVEKAVG